jgi:hypothetical protein
MIENRKYYALHVLCKYLTDIYIYAPDVGP